jgi:hypothetical protein
MGVATTASQGRIGWADLRLRPLLREGELPETIPGLVVTQHSGDGKANQYFVRGFNLDHGTDFQTRIEGMPVNMPSHAHGQGYGSTLSVWALELDSELLFIGDGGATEPSDRSRRSGVTFANFYRPIPQLSLDANVSLARARFAGVPRTERHIPGALENVVAAGVTWSGRAGGPFGALRVRHFGAYPLTEDNSVRAMGTTLFNADAGLFIAGMRLQLTVLNLLDERANDIQYYYSSRLPGEAVGGASDIHFHPVEPRQLRLSLGRGL